MDAELFRVVEFFVAFGRQYTFGEAIRESDLTAWAVEAGSRDAVELKVASLLARNRLDKVERVEQLAFDAPIPVEAPPLPVERYEPADSHEPAEHHD